MSALQTLAAKADGPVLYRESFSDGAGTDFVISDGSRDRHGTRINPNGWDLGDFRKNPIALWAHGKDPRVGSAPLGTWANLRVQSGQLIGTFVRAAVGTGPIIDELCSLVEQGILRAVSAGFSVLQEGDKSRGEYDFVKQELLEASIVSVGSNRNTLALARSLNISNETMSLVFGEQAETRLRDVTTTGEHAATSRIRKPIKMESLSKRIEGAHNDLNAARDALTAHIADDNAEPEQTETLAGEIELREQRLSSLERAEKALAARTVKTIEHDPNEGRNFPAPAVRRPLGVQVREPKPEDLLVRAAACHLISYATHQPVDRVLEARYPDHEGTQVVTRAAVAAATTTAAGWALELVETVTADFMSNLDPDAVFPRLAGAGTQLSFGPGRGAIKIPSRAATPSISGSFVVEGGAIPVRRLGLTSITLSPHKVAVISAFTREIVRYSNPQIEGIVREAIREDTAITLDGLLLDAVAGTTTRPAGLLYGVTALTASTAGGYAAIIEDITSLAGPFYAANAGRSLVMLMNPAQALALSMAPGPDGRFGWTEQFTRRFSVFESTNVPSGTIIVIDAADFVSVLGMPEFEVSDSATLHMEDSSPLAIGTAGSPNTVAAPVQSMFQTNSIALRMVMDATWAMRRSGMIQHMAGVDWAPA